MCYNSKMQMICKLVTASFTCYWQYCAAGIKMPVEWRIAQKRIEEKIMQNGYKTKSRSYIMEFFTAHKEQIVSAADIHHYLEENGKQVNLATIYRNLDKMTDEGILLKYKTAKDEHAVYQYTDGHPECHEHLHLQCVRCGRVIHLECGFMKDIRAHLEEHHGFALECSSSVLYGMCRECKEMESGSHEKNHE